MSWNGPASARMVGGDLELLHAGDTQFAAEAASFSSVVEQRPHLVAPVRTSSEVAAAVRYAVDRRMAVFLQATGHGCTEIDAAENGLLISTRAMNGVSIDPTRRTATVRAGTRWAEVIAAAAPHGLIPRSGSSPDVGVVGYTLGGGVPITGRTFGFAADVVRRADVVLADGSEVTVDADHEAELFWGLRGGKGPFCAVTALTFGLEEAATINGGTLYFAGEHTAALLPAYRDWAAELPESMTTSLALYRLPPFPQVPEPLRGVPSVGLRIVHVGDPAEADALLAPMLTAAPLLMGGVGEMPFTASGAIYNDPPGPLPALAAGALLRELTDADIAALLAVGGPQQNIPFPKIELRHLGGAFGRAPGGIDAVSGRHGAFAAHVVGMLTPETAAVTPQITEALLGALAPAAAGGQQVNFARPEARATDVWGPEVLGRLSGIKAAYDPGNVFRGPLSFSAPIPAQSTPG